MWKRNLRPQSTYGKLSLMATPSSKSGFTIVELLIVIVVIGILAAITIVAFNGVQKRAQQSKRVNDIAVIEKAILAARINTGKTTTEITGSGMTSFACERAGDNPGLVEPRLLDNTSHQCWTTWRTVIDRLSAAANMDLSALKLGDPAGNPYFLNENEGELNGGSLCVADDLGYFTGSGTAFIVAKRIAAQRTC